MSAAGGEVDEAAGRPGAGRPGAARLGSARLGWLAAGALAVLGGTALGWDASALEAIVRPPALVRAVLVAVAVLVGLRLLVAAVSRVRAADGGGGERDVPGLIRGVRLVFLAVAAFAAGAGWLLGHPLPFVIALIVAGVDILETSFLLLVVTLRREP